MIYTKNFNKSNTANPILDRTVIISRVCYINVQHIIHHYMYVHDLVHTCARACTCTIPCTLMHTYARACTLFMQGYAQDNYFE